MYSDTFRRTRITDAMLDSPDWLDIKERYSEAVVNKDMRLVVPVFSGLKDAVIILKDPDLHTIFDAPIRDIRDHILGALDKAGCEKVSRYVL